MNLFYLDTDLDKCAEYHIDKHVLKMQLEAAQLMATTLWVDKLFGYVPRKLDGEELAELRSVMATEPDIDSRTFIRYKAVSPNHPCGIWTRTSRDNFEWVHCYANALDSEAQWRGYKPHASCAEVNRMPDPSKLPYKGLTAHAQAMPEACKREDAVEAYRMYYKQEKAGIASWKRRGEPYWYGTL